VFADAHAGECVWSIGAEFAAGLPLGGVGLEIKAVELGQATGEEDKG